MTPHGRNKSKNKFSVFFGPSDLNRATHLSATFILAALPKIQDPTAFAISVEGYRVVTGNLMAWIALALPWLELVAGFGLLIPQIRRSSTLVITLLLIAFILLHASASTRARYQLRLL